MSFVLDNSVAMRWLNPVAEIQHQTYANEVLDVLQRGSCLAPAMFWYEASSVAAMLVRQNLASPADARRFMKLLRSLDIRPVEVAIGEFAERVLMTALEQPVTGYDAAYLMSCVDEGVPLATLDGGLKKVAKRLGIPLFMPS